MIGCEPCNSWDMDLICNIWFYKQNNCSTRHSTSIFEFDFTNVTHYDIYDNKNYLNSTRLDDRILIT